MAIVNATPDGNAPRPTGPGAAPGPFVGIGLPMALAVALAGKRRVVALEPEAIATAGLDQIEDPMIGCLLLGSKADALDIIADLVEAGYRGPVTVVAPPLPNPRMVERELSRAAKPMAVKLVVR
ncbi:hypothetical protein [Pseudotabrizicola sp. 4114]|uniref:hypothetical protein n=1 Tax=Pseudotabrizicola sp. 4114 TaxID=2817731 RepID=UPI0028611C80|nr:alkanesulfonate monooxygenase SsuD/methylene tetrahydromethanopterin reductase-like flavin-dependent oxidoreductase (luciferase family) [Pseudorhodobacter sp. 4114]